MDMVTYAALQKQIRDAAGGGNADRDVFYFDVYYDSVTGKDTISCTFDELKAACQSGKILSFKYGYFYYFGYASMLSISDTKLKIDAIVPNGDSFPASQLLAVNSDGSITREKHDQLATIQSVHDTVQEELSYAGGGIIHLGCMGSNDFTVMQEGITISDLFDAADVWSPVKACLHSYANPVLDQAFMGQIFANDMRYDQFARICTFPVLYKGRSFELTVHEDETIEFAEVASATA
ncbi:MAG: hypothetical protein IJA31_03150 [Clostridia bacterium]|nr:hypothetical protein [Clostridia bacterium]